MQTKKEHPLLFLSRHIRERLENEKKEERKAYGRKYYHDNKKKIKEYKKQFYEQNKDKYHEYYEKNIDKYKEKYQENRKDIVSLNIEISEGKYIIEL